MSTPKYDKEQKHVKTLHCIKATGVVCSWNWLSGRWRTTTFVSHSLTVYK